MMSINGPLFSVRYGPENIKGLRKFVISEIKSQKVKTVAQKIRRLSFNVRAVFDYLKMTKKIQTAEIH